MAAAPDLQIYGGNFQDLEGNPLSLGYLLFQLSHDEQATVALSQVVSGLKIKVLLDATGNIPINPPTYIWANSALLPSGSYYTVRAFKSDGTEVWNSPQTFALITSPDPLNFGTLVPLQPPGSGLSGGGSTLLLEVDGTPTSNQSLLNFVDTATVTWSNPSGGVVKATAVSSGGSGLPLPTTARFTLWKFSGFAQTAAQATGVLVDDLNAVEIYPNGINLLALSVVPASATSGVCGAVTNSGTDVELLDPPFTYDGTTISFQGTLQVGGTTAPFYVGMSSIVPTGSPPTTVPTTVDCMVFATLTGHANFQVICSASGTATTVDTGVPVDTNRHKITLTYTATPAVTAYLDGVLVATITTNTPVAPMGVLWFLPEGVGTFSSNIEYYYAQITTP